MKEKLGKGRQEKESREMKVVSQNHPHEILREKSKRREIGKVK